MLKNTFKTAIRNFVDDSTAKAVFLFDFNHMLRNAAEQAHFGLTACLDGNTILKKLKSKEKFKNIPVIICSAKGSEFNKVALLNEGADDYLVKPFGMMELVARVNAVLRRITKEKQVVLSNGNIKVDLEKHEAYVDNKEIVLTLKEYDLLVYFLSNLNKVISRDELIEKVWGVDFIGESRTIDVHVGTLRSKISSSNSLIQTVRGVGYRMEKLDEKEN